MSWDIIEGNWTHFKGIAKAKWGKLGDDQLATIAGSREHLTGGLREAYGITQDQAARQVQVFEDAHKDYQPNMPA